jgi:hypothetical protein
VSSNELARGHFVPELVAAGAVLILGAVGAAKLALAPPTDVPIPLTAWSTLMLALMVVLAASGIECIRRRHLLFVILAPLAPALVTVVYVVGTGQTAYLNGVWVPVLVMAMVASRRSAFA